MAVGDKTPTRRSLKHPFRVRAAPHTQHIFSGFSRYSSRFLIPPLLDCRQWLSLLATSPAWSRTRFWICFCSHSIVQRLRSMFQSLRGIYSMRCQAIALPQTPHLCLISSSCKLIHGSSNLTSDFELIKLTRQLITRGSSSRLCICWLVSSQSLFKTLR